jgi:hypothetical protein
MISGQLRASNAVTAVRPRPRGQAIGQSPAREDAGAPRRRQWLYLIFKDHQSRARIKSRCGGWEAQFQKALGK